MPFLDAVVTALDSELGPDKYTVEKSLRTSSGEAYSVTIAIGNLRVRFVRDRGQVFAEAKGLEGKRWHDVRTLAERVRGIPTTQREGAESLERNVELLAMFRDAFAEILGPGYEAAKTDLLERHRLGLGGLIAEWIREHPPAE